MARKLRTRHDVERYREPVYRTIASWLQAVHPVSTGIVIAGLARPEWLVEVEVDVIAVIPGDPRHSPSLHARRTQLQSAPLPAGT